MSITEAAASVAARAFFYPSLAWNIARSRLQETWHWWDEITPNVVLGAIPFYSTLDELKKLGVQAVVTLNETFEVFITTEQYQDSGFQHLHIPTVDFLYAPPTEDLHRGADFIHEVASAGGKTYVHCKAGRGRSTTLVLCYLIKYCGHTPEEAYTFVREKRPQVCLAQGQWTAVCGFYVSCCPEKGLKVEDFPYPSLLPLAPGKQGSDGLEASMSLGELESKAEHLSAAPADLAHTSAQINAFKRPVSGVDAPTSQCGRSEPQPSSNGGSEEVLQLSASCERIAEDKQPGAESRVLSPAEDGEDVIVVSNVGSGSASSDSVAALGGIATGLATCCIHSRDPGTTQTVQEPESCPPRSASPAIKIPGASRIQSSVNDGDANQSSTSGSGEGHHFSSSGSKASITLEPSGSLPDKGDASPKQSWLWQNLWG